MEKLRLGFRERFLFPVILVTLALVILVSNSVFADTQGPIFVDVFPAADTVISSGKVTISVTAKDTDKVSASSVAMKVDGVTVQTITQYGWIDEWTDDYTTLDIFYPATLANGSHTIELSVNDMAGNNSSYNWSFIIGEPPRISSITPTDGSTVSDRRPPISAIVTDNPLVEQSSIVMTLNGKSVPFTYDPFSGLVAYIPPAELPNDSVNTVTLAATDTTGISKQVQWSFRVSTYGDMTFEVNDSTCQACHDRKRHPMTSCNKCHGINLSVSSPVYPLDDCYLCHFDSTTYPVAYHTNGLPVSDGANHPVKTTDSCIECHTKVWTSGIPLYHDVTNTAERHNTTSVGCDNCHAGSLTREHVQRTDDTGQTLNCYTCHSNPDAQVQTAINTKDSSCTACHNLGADGGHPAHPGGLDSYCQTCHSGSILTEQQFHKESGCIVCHGSGVKDIVKYSIDTKDTNCFSCHTQGHNVNFVQNVPADILQFPGFIWSLPMDAVIWAGEPWFKSEYNTAGAKLIISNRIPSVDTNEIYSWYEQQMIDNGWLLVTTETGSSDSFTVTFSKQNRLVTVYFYGGETHDPTSRFIGYKIEILYK